MISLSSSIVELIPYLELSKLRGRGWSEGQDHCVSTSSGCRPCFDRSLTDDGAHSDGSAYRGSRPGRTLVGKGLDSSAGLDCLTVAVAYQPCLSFRPLLLLLWMGLWLLWCIWTFSLFYTGQGLRGSCTAVQWIASCVPAWVVGFVSYARAYVRIYPITGSWHSIEAVCSPPASPSPAHHHGMWIGNGVPGWWKRSPRGLKH